MAKQPEFHKYLPLERLLKKSLKYTTCSRSGLPRPYILWCHGRFSAVSFSGGFAMDWLTNP